MKHFSHPFQFAPHRAIFRSQPRLLPLPFVSTGILLHGEEEGKTLAKPEAILEPPCLEKAVRFIQDVMKKSILIGAGVLLTNTFGVRYLSPNDRKKTVSSHVSLARSTIDALTNEKIISSPEAIDVYAWFGPLGDCYKYKPKKKHESEMFALHLDQAKAAQENRVRPLFETISSVAQGRAIALACKEAGILSPYISFVVDKDRGLLAADRASFSDAVAAVLDILPEAKIGLNCSTVQGSRKAVNGHTLGVYYPNAAQNRNPWIAEKNGGHHNQVDEELAENIVDFAQETDADLVGLCCGADERSLGLIAKANKKAIDRALALK